MQSVDMAFDYDKQFGEDAFPEAYERLLLEAIQGDATLFTRSDGIENAWRIIETCFETVEQYERMTSGEWEQDAPKARP